MIRPVEKRDAAHITAIYNHYINNTVVTFETDTIAEHDIIDRFEKVQASGLPWLVAENEQGEVLGYAYATKWRERFAYRFSVEVTVYVSPNHGGKGLGTKLYDALFETLRQSEVHSVIGGITLPNPASVALHEKFGMHKVAHFEEVGFKFDKWQDVGYWQGSL